MGVSSMESFPETRACPADDCDGTQVLKRKG